MCGPPSRKVFLGWESEEAPRSRRGPTAPLTLCFNLGPFFYAFEAWQHEKPLARLTAGRSLWQFFLQTGGPSRCPKNGKTTAIREPFCPVVRNFCALCGRIPTPWRFSVAGPTASFIICEPSHFCQSCGSETFVPKKQIFFGPHGPLSCSTANRGHFRRRMAKKFMTLNQNYAPQRPLFGCAFAGAGITTPSPALKIEPYFFALFFFYFGLA